MSRATHGPTPDAQGYNAPSLQTLGVDGYYPEPVVATYQQVGKYRLPLASVANQNDGGLLRRDFVGEVSSRPNVFMPIWSAPNPGQSVSQVGGAVTMPISSYYAGQATANPITVNADQASMLSSFAASRSPRFTGSGLGFSTSGGD